MTKTFSHERVSPSWPTRASQLRRIQKGRQLSSFLIFVEFQKQAQNNKSYAGTAYFGAAMNDEERRLGARLKKRPRKRDDDTTIIDVVRRLDVDRRPYIQRQVSSEVLFPRILDQFSSKERR
jgi:hypothetical protein